ncbi:MAG: glycosyltransferase family 39 protein [Anaerolineae bacterium]
MWAVAGVLLAFALRLWGLNATSLWYDETFVLYHAQQGFLSAISGLVREDNALPLHGSLLALWIGVVGSSEFTARYLSVLLGTVAAPIMYRLGRSVSQRELSGLGSMLVYTILPIFVYYSQEVRMYALALPLAAGFMWAGQRLVMRGKAVAAYVSLGAAMLVAHLYTALAWASVCIWGTLMVVLVPPTEDRRTLGARSWRGGRRVWWLANLLLAGLASPIFLWALWRVRMDATAVSAIPFEALRGIPVLFGVGQYLPAPWSIPFIVLACAAILVTLGVGLRRRRFDRVVWHLTMLTLPIGALFLLTLVKAKWSERYLLPSWGVAIAVAVGNGWESLLWSLRRRVRSESRGRDLMLRKAGWVAGLFCSAAWIALAVLALARQAEGTWAIAIRDEWHPRPDFRGVARYIEAHDSAGDAIVVVGGYAASTLDYYYEGPATLFGLPPESRVLDTRDVVDLRSLHTLEDAVGDRTRLWLVLWQEHLADPTNLVQSVLVASCRRLPVDAAFTNVWVLLFDVSGCRPLDRLATPPIPLEATFEAPIELLGYDLIRRGRTLEVDLWWEGTGDLSKDYIVFVHLLDSVDGSADTIIDQHDHIAGADAYPTSAWQAGVRLRDRFFLEVPEAGCPACRLRVGLYTPEARLRLADGRDALEIPVP